MTLLTLITALSISGVAAYYSIIGLAKIFAAAYIPIIIMGGVLEVGKLVTAVWLHRHWTVAPFFLKTYLTFAVIVLMFITSMGIFGFLSSAHIEQTAEAEENVALVEQIDRKIGRYTGVIVDAENNISKIESKDLYKNTEINEQISTEELRVLSKRNQFQLLVDEQNAIITSASSNLDLLEEYVRNQDIRSLQSLVGTVPDGKYGTNTARKVSQYRDKEELRVDTVLLTARNKITEIRDRESVEISKSNELIDRLRDKISTDGISEIDTAKLQRLQTSIIESEDEITILNSEKFALESSYRKLEAEVGPLKYIAEMVYAGDTNADILEEAVRWVIIAIIFVFDPLAVLLIISANMSYMMSTKYKKKQVSKTISSVTNEDVDSADNVLIKTANGGWKQIKTKKVP